MRIIDITRTVQDAPVYPGSVPTQINRVFEISKGENSNFSHIITNSHAGTHVDAPNHFIMDGLTVDKMDLSLFYGKCRVITFRENSILELDDVVGKVEKAERIVVHGGSFTYFTKAAAEYIVSCGVKTIVTDAWSVAPLYNEREIHRIFLSEGIAIVENVILDGVEDGEYTLIAFPVKYGKCDGAPVRAVLIED
jgi:arylformamidase